MTEQPATEATDLDTCRPVQVDGETIRVRGSGELTVEGQEALTALVRVAKDRMEAEADQTTELDKKRRYLRPVRATILSDDPDGVHLSVYSWLPMFDAWATGPGICGESMRQGPLPADTEVTCTRCLEWKPKYDRYLAPGYQPGDDDVDALRERLVREMHRRSTHLDLLTEDHPLGRVADGVVANVRGEVLGLQSALGIALGGVVQGGDADLRSREYYKAWLAKGQSDQFRCRCVSCERVLAGRGNG